jgi:hypothetical protein
VIGRPRTIASRLPARSAPATDNGGDRATHGRRGPQRPPGVDALDRGQHRTIGGLVYHWLLDLPRYRACRWTERVGGEMPRHRAPCAARARQPGRPTGGQRGGTSPVAPPLRARRRIDPSTVGAGPPGQDTCGLATVARPGCLALVRRDGTNVLSNDMRYRGQGGCGQTNKMPSPRARGCRGGATGPRHLRSCHSRSSRLPRPCPTRWHKRSVQRHALSGPGGLRPDQQDAITPGAGPSVHMTARAVLKPAE